MKKLVILFILIFNSNVAFAEDSTAKFVIQPGDYINGMIFDATGYTHGVEMNQPGTAWLVNSEIVNAGTALNSDGRHGDGRGVVVTGAGAILYVTNTKSINNSEDGFRVSHGGKLIMERATASGNMKNGFFVGEDGTLEMVKSTGTRNRYGFMAAKGFLNVKINNSKFFDNKSQGIQAIEGESLDISYSEIYDNDTDRALGEDYGGIAIFGVKKVNIEKTAITRNYTTGLLSESTLYNGGVPVRPDDAPVRVHLEDVKIIGDEEASALHHGDADVISIGDSHVTILNSTVAGKCLEQPDPSDITSIGIITVDGKEVTNDRCP